MEELLIHDPATGLVNIFDLRSINPPKITLTKPMTQFHFCQGFQRILLVANFDMRGGSDLLCVHSGTREYSLLHSTSIIGGNPTAFGDMIEGSFGNFCSNYEDILMSGGDFNGDGMADLMCRHQKHDGSAHPKLASVAFSKLV